MLIKKYDKSLTFLLGSINILLNNYFYQFLIILFFLNGDFIIISEITFSIAPLIFLKESFSSNHRTLLVSDKRHHFYKIFFKQRVQYATLTLIFYLFFINYFAKNEDTFFLILILILINFTWLNELTITSYEINYDKKKIIKNLFFLIIIYSFFIYYIFFPSKNLLYTCLIIIFFLALNYIYKHKIDLFNFFKNLKISKKINYKVLSTTSINLANLIWRIFFFLLLEKEFSGVLFSIFAIMSFPSSFYNNTMGMTLEIQNKKKTLFKKILLIYYFFVLSIIYYIFLNKVAPLNNVILSDFFYMTTVFSFVGSLIMIFGTSKRIKIINYKKIKRKTLFQVDVIYAIINILSLATVYFLFGSYYFSILFFISSIFSLIYYFYYKNFD